YWNAERERALDPAECAGVADVGLTVAGADRPDSQRVGGRNPLDIEGVLLAFEEQRGLAPPGRRGRHGAGYRPGVLALAPEDGHRGHGVRSEGDRHLG